MISLFTARNTDTFPTVPADTFVYTFPRPMSAACRLLGGLAFRTGTTTLILAALE